jgi:hypothetical protein
MVGNPHVTSCNHRTSQSSLGIKWVEQSFGRSTNLYHRRYSRVKDSLGAGEMFQIRAPSLVANDAQPRWLRGRGPVACSSCLRCCSHLILRRGPGHNLLLTNSSMWNIHHESRSCSFIFRRETMDFRGFSTSVLVYPCLPYSIYICIEIRSSYMDCYGHPS